MKQLFKLNIVPRADTGRSASRRLRKVNQVPAILYGKHTKPEAFSVDAPEFTRLVKSIAGSASLVELHRSDKGEIALSFLKEIQRDPITDRYLHVDLQEVKADEKMEIRVRVVSVGEAFGVKNQSGMLEMPNPLLRIRCLPKDLPSFIEVDVSEMHNGDTLHISSLKPIPGVEFRDDPNLPVFSCIEPEAEEVVATPAAGAAPAAGTAPAAPAAGATPAAAPAAGAAPAKAAAPAKK